MSKNVYCHSLRIVVISLFIISCKSEAQKYADIYTKGYYRKAKYINNEQIKCIGYKKSGFLDSCEIQYNEKGIIKYITNYRNGKTLGDALEFYDNGTLKTYYFMAKQDTCCIQQEFNKAGIRTTKFETPSYTNLDFDIKKDSVVVQIIVPKILFKKYSLYVSDGRDYRKAELKNSKDYTNDYEYTYAREAVNYIYIYLRHECFFKNNKPEVLNDTIAFKRLRH